jgi:fermentation-respiration switch protein FrsA (DUF1100 family)
MKARIMLYFIIGFIAFILFVRHLEQKTLFIPAKTITYTPQLKKLAYEDVYFPSGPYKINGWFIPANPKSATILYCHGNAGNIGDRLDKMEMFHNIGLNVFIFDYRGYGNSQGHSSEKGLYEDARAAYDYLISRGDIDKNKIIDYGTSLGGSVAIDLATQRKFEAIIIDSSFSSAADMARRIYPMIPTFFMSVKLDSVSKIKNLTIPKLFIHSTQDEVVPFKLGKKLYDAASDPKEFVAIKGGHNDAHWQDQSAFTVGIQNFLKKYGII